MDSTITKLLSSPNIDWQAVLETTVASFNCTTGTLHRLDEETNLLTLVAHQGIPPQLMPVIEKIPVGKGIAGAAAERREPVELCNLQSDLGGVAKPGARATKVQGSLAVPCLRDGKVRGTLGVGMMVPHEFSEDEKIGLLEIGRAVAGRI